MSARKGDEASALERFRKDTAEHQLQVIKNDGLHRHLRFRKPGTSCYGFDIVTWPGFLAITGDMGAAMFTRLHDMLEFFRSDQRTGDAPDALRINSGYWAEKCVANDGEKKEFSSELFEALVKRHFDEFVAEHGEPDQEDEADGFFGHRAPEWAAGLWDELKSEVLYLESDDVGSAIEAMERFKPDGDTPYASFRFTDAWEYASSLQDYTFHFLWRLYAIAHAVKAYDALPRPEKAEDDSLEAVARDLRHEARVGDLEPQVIAFMGRMADRIEACAVQPA